MTNKSRIIIKQTLFYRGDKSSQGLNLWLCVWFLWTKLSACHLTEFLCENRSEKKYYWFVLLYLVSQCANSSWNLRQLLLFLWLWSIEIWLTYTSTTNNKVKDKRLNQLLPDVKMRISRNNYFGIRQEKSKVRI